MTRSLTLSPDMSLWLTDGMGGGTGGDWGQRIGREYLFQEIDSDSIHILLHEIVGVFFYWYTPRGADCGRAIPLLWTVS